MNDILEFAPDVTDTKEEVNQLIKDSQDLLRETAMPDDFIVFPKEDDEPEEIKESLEKIYFDDIELTFSELYTKENKKTHKLYSFGFANERWWWFERTSNNEGRVLHGPFKNKSDILESIGGFNA